MRYKKAFLIGASLVVLIWAISVAFFFMPKNGRDNVNPQRQAEILAITLDRGQLAPLPSRAENLTVMTLGNMFARGFQVGFTAPLEDIDDWLANSPGLVTLTPEVDGNQRHYLFSSDDAATINVMIDESCGCVVIEAWSS